ncbi:MAG: hypothetical protein ACE5GM_08675, partial [bacterium]
GKLTPPQKGPYRRSKLRVGEHPPGFVGTFHYSCQLVLVMMGVGVNMAASFAIVFHLVGFLPVTVVGLFYVFKGQMSLTQLQHVEE